MQRVIFDTAGFLAGLQNLYEEVYTTNEVLDEVKDNLSNTLLSYSLEAGKVKVIEPSKESVSLVLSVSKLIGEYSLSRADISIIALAIDLKPSIVITDDISIINILNYLKINYKTVKLRKINIKQKTYKYICKSCKREYIIYYNECPICGGKLLKLQRE
ncbi:MAG: DNA-binding protein [Sulfolobaceae archaeon]